MDTSHNYLREPSCEDYPFIGAKRYIDGLSQPEKEDILASMAKDVGKIRVENIPDEEDLTQVRQGCHHVLKFKDKIFNPAECSGMGKVFLRKNMVLITCDTSKNILTLSMFEDKHGLPMVNTIFIIQYDYDLDGGFITLPENSVLLFAGGSLRNGTIMLRNTLVLPVALDIEHYMSVNIRGAYKEGSLVYLRKKLRLFDGTHWITIGAHDLTPIMNAVKKYLNFALDIVAPFKIELSTEKNYVERGLNNIKVSWSYNRLINDQEILLTSDPNIEIHEELDKNIRSYTFENIELSEPVSIVIATTYKGDAEMKSVTLGFDRNPGLVIDDELDENSTNPVTNRAITRVIRSLELNLENFQQYVNETFLTKVDAENTYLKQVDFDLSEVYDALGNKVDKEAGKGLSSNDFTDSLKDKLEGINLDNYALKNHTHTEYADKNHTHSEYANVNHTHVISDVQGLAEALSRAGVTYQLSKDGSNLVLIGSDGSRSSVAIAGIDENALKTLIQAKLRLLHGNGTISLTYDGTNLATVQDEKGGDTSGITLQDLKNNLKLSHPNDRIQLKYGSENLGDSVPDNTGEGGGGGDDDGLPGNILTYFIATTSNTVPDTPPDGELPPEGSDWSVNCPDREEGRYIWMSQIYETYSQTHYGNWSDPILLSDGSLSSGSDTSDREYIYARADIEDWEPAGIPNPNNNPERWPSESGPWYDNPQGVTQELRFEFISFKYKTNEDTWSAWQGPYVWSSYGRNGTDGDGVEYIFFAGNSTPIGNDDPSTWYTDAESKRGDKDEYEVAYNSDEYIPRGSQWKDDPQELIPGQTQWVSTRKYRNDTDPQSSEQGDSYWHQYSLPTIWNHYAQDITSAGALDFDNQTMGIPVDTEGNNLDFVDTSDGYIYYGIGDIPIQLLTCNGLFDGDNPKWTQQEASSYVGITNNHVTVNIPAGTLRNIVGKTYTLRFTATAANVEPRTGVIKLVGLTTGSDGCSYKLKVNTRVIKSGVGTSSEQKVPDRIIPEMLKTKGAVPEAEYSVTNLPSGFTIEYLKDNETSTQRLTVDEISTLAITDKVLLQLKYNDFIIDEELIFVIQDGVEGIPATVYNIVPLSSSVSWDPETNKTTGTLTFEAYRKIGANDEEYLSGGKFGTSTDIGSIEVRLDNHTITATESQHIYTANIDSNGQYSVIQIDLSVSSPLTKVASIVIPIIQKGASGSQTLLLGIMRYRKVNCLETNEGITFYDGRNPDPDAQNGYFQDFVIWNGANSENWGTYLCVNKVNLPPAAIPYTGISLGHFTKMDHTFAEIVDYLIAHRAWIDELSVRQVVVFDDATPVPNIVAGMTSGSTLPTELTEKHISNGLDIRIWAGSIPSNGDISSAPFTVDSSGHVKATDATISGTVYATNGSFTGEVHATSGSFKGSINATEFKTGENGESGLVVTLSFDTQNADIKKAYLYYDSNDGGMNLAIYDFNQNMWVKLNLLNMIPIGNVETETFYTINTPPGQAAGYVDVQGVTYIKRNGKYYLNNSEVTANVYQKQGTHNVIMSVDQAGAYFVLSGCVRYQLVEITNGLANVTNNNLLVGRSFNFVWSGTTVTIDSSGYNYPRIYTNNSSSETPIDLPNDHIYFTDSFDITSTDGTIGTIPAYKLKNVTSQGVNIASIGQSNTDYYNNISQLLSVQAPDLQGVIYNIPK